MYSTNIALGRVTAPSIHRSSLPAIAMLIFALGWTNHSSAQTFNLLHVFETEDACDQHPHVEPGTPTFSGILAQGTDGNIYGTTAAGGVCVSAGTVYQMTRSGAVKVLYSFNGAGKGGLLGDGGLTLGADGNFYGTTKSGGTNNQGTIFMITPGGALTYLYQFNGTNGAYPTAPPILATDGYFYGTASDGGSRGSGGVVYKMASKSPWTVTIYSLSDFGYGYTYAPLLQAADGNFYGTATHGGAHGPGAVFRMTSNGTFTTVYSFDNVNGAQPIGPLIQGSDGNFYGTTYYGGNLSACNGMGCGVVFQLTPTGKITILHSFNGADGSAPLGGLLQASDGNLYGVTSGQGTSGYGTLYKLSPQGKSFVFSVLVNFDLPTTGQQPQLTLLQHTSGFVYGDTWDGGTVPPGDGEGSQGGQGTFYSLNSSALTPFVSLIPAGATTGKSVIILGQGFTGSTTVSFNGALAAITSRTATSLTATVPSAGVTGTVTVTTGNLVLKSNKPFIVIPTIISFSPTSGDAGDQVVIQGSGFTGATQVTFGGVKATIFTVNSATQITATVPTGAKSGKIAVKTAGGTAVSPGTFTVLP